MPCFSHFRAFFLGGGGWWWWRRGGHGFLLTIVGYAIWGTRKKAHQIIGGASKIAREEI